MFLHRINRIRNSEYAKNVFIVTTGTFIAQILPIFAAPVLSRIYSPTEYGILGLYLSITGIVSIFGTFKYSQAVLTVKDDRDAEILTNLCVWIATGITLITCLFVWLIGPYIANLINVKELGFWFYFAPVTVFFNGLIEVFLIFANRNKRYRILNYSRVGSVIVQILLSVFIGILLKSEKGLFTGLLVSQLLNVIYLTIKLNSTTGIKLYKFFRKFEYKRLLKQFRNFPIFALPSDLINYFSNQLPILMIGLYAPSPVANVGAFNMSTRLLGIPSQLISSSISEVFRQRASKDFNSIGDCRAIFLKTFKVLFFLAFVPFALLAIFSPFVFSFVLGSEWRLAGQMSQALCFMYFMRFSISPLSYVVYIRNKQFWALLIDAYLFLSNFLIFYLSLLIFKLSILNTLGIYSLNYGLLYILTYFVSYNLTVKKNEDVK